MGCAAGTAGQVGCLRTGGGRSGQPVPTAVGGVEGANKVGLGGIGGGEKVEDTMALAPQGRAIPKDEEDPDYDEE